MTVSVRSMGELHRTVTPPEPAARRPATPPHPAAPTHSFREVLEALGKESDRGEALVRRAVTGKTMPSQDLLALQAGIYRYGEVVDLSTRLVDRAQSGLKTILQGQ